MITLKPERKNLNSLGAVKNVPIKLLVELVDPVKFSPRGSDGRQWSPSTIFVRNEPTDEIDSSWLSSLQRQRKSIDATYINLISG